MARKFKIGDMIIIESCCGTDRLCNNCENTVFEITGIAPASHGYCLYGFSSCYTTAKEARLATDREKFLYYTYGKIKPDENNG